MFEKILEKVLMKAAGDYIDGIDSQNLKVGIWGGDVVIENVSLKDGIIDMLNLPVNLRFSHVGKLTLKVPWKNLSSAPVEVYLDGVYLILSPKHESQWEFKDFKAFKEKFENINEYANECLKKFQDTLKDQQKKKEDNQGYVDKLTVRIIDNLQVNIKSIHVRYEDTLAQQPYAWGITLDQLDIYTIDKYEKRIYVDRTLSENKDEPMRKVLKLSNFGIYWNAKEDNMISHEEKHIKLDVMEGMIKRGNEETRKYCKYLLSISCMAKLVQSKAGLAVEKPDIPEIALSIDLDRIDFKLEQQQLQQIILMAEFFSKYQKKLADQKKVDKALPESEIKKNQKFFCQKFKIIQESESKDLDQLVQSDIDRFQTIVTSLEYEDLYECTKQVMIDIAKERKIEDIEKTRQKKKQGMFGGWFGGGKKKDEEEESLVTEQDLGNIDKFFEDNFSGEGLTVTNYVRPASYVWFVLNFSLKGGEIQLNKENPVTKDLEGIQFEYNLLAGNLLLRDNNMELMTNLKSMKLDNITHISDSSETSIQNFLRPNQTVYEENLINVKFEQKPIDAPHIDSRVKVAIKSARIEYNPIFVQRLTMFFDVKVEDEDLKNAAFDQVEELKANVQESSTQAIQSNTVMELDVHLESPIIVLPFKADGRLDNEAWILNLGDLTVKSNPAILKKDLEEQHKFKDMMDIKLTDIKMRYFPELEYYNKYELDQNAEWIAREGKTDKYTIIDNFSINVGIVILKKTPESKDVGKIQVNGGLPCLNMNLNQEMYKRLLKMGEIFTIEEEELEAIRASSSMNVEELLEDRKALMKTAKHLGPLMLRGETIHTWEKKTAVLSGNYLYIFASPRDNHPELSYWIKNSDVTQITQEAIGYQNAFLVKNRYTEIYLACDKAPQSQKWMDALESVRTKKKVHKIDNYDAQSQSQISQQSKSQKPSKESQEDCLQKNMSVSFAINDVKLNLFDTGKSKEFLVFQTKSIGLLFDQYSQSFDCKLSLGGMYLEDKIRDYMDPKLKNFITSEEDSGAEQVDLIVVEVAQKQRTHPHFKNVEMDINVKFGNLIINFKPQALLKVLAFIKVEDQEQKEQQIKQLTQSQLRANEAKQAQANLKDESDIASSDLQSSFGPGQQQQGSDVILMSAAVQLKQIKINFVNRKTHLAMGSFQIQNIGIIFQQLQDEMKLTGTLGNLQLIDFTNYPNTLYKEEDWQKAKETEILGLLKQENGDNNSESLLTIGFRALNDGSPKIQEDNVATFLDVTLSQININFMMQPVMRFLDYSLVQLLGPLSTPELFSDEAENMTQEEKEKLKQRKQEIKDPMAAVKQFSKEKVKRDLFNPKGMKMDVKIKKPLIQVKPSPDAKEYMQISLGNIFIQNKRIYSDERLVESEVKEITKVYSEQFNIHLQDMELGFIKDGKHVEMSKLFHFNIQIDMPGFVNEFFYVYKNKVQIDKTMKLRCYISPIIIRLTSKDYGFIMKCLSHNISYDDGCDRHMIHDYWQNVELQKEMEQKKNKQNKLLAIQNYTAAQDRQKKKSAYLLEDQQQLEDDDNEDEVPFDQGGGIDFQLDMENLSLFTAEGDKSIPFARVTLNDLRVQFIKHSNGDIFTNLYGLELDGSCFKYDKIQDVYVESGLFRQIDVNKTYTEDQMCVITNLLASVEETSIEGEKFEGYHFPDFPNTLNQSAFKENINLQFILEIFMESNGNKKMKIKVQDFKLIAETGHLLKLAGFANTDDSVLPPPTWFIPERDDPENLYNPQPGQKYLEKPQQQQDKPFFDLEAEKKKEEEEQQEQGGLMEIDIIIRNVIICALIPNSTQILAIKGEFNIGIQMQPRSVTSDEIKHKVSLLKVEWEQMILKKKEERAKEQEEKKSKKDKKDEEKTKSIEEEFPFRPDSEFKTVNLVQQFDVKLSQLEIFICNKADLQTKEFKDVQKRVIMHPFEITVLMQTYNPPLPGKWEDFYTRQSIGVKIQQLFLKISTKDALTLQESLNYITESMNEGKTPEQIEKEKQEQEEKKKQEEAKKMENFDEKLQMTAEQKLELQELNDDPSQMTETMIKCEMSGVRIMIINDIGNIFTPVLDFNILQTVILVNNNALQSKISIIPLIFKAKYYNPRAGEWEPIIEEIGFNIDVVNNTIGETKSHIVLEINDTYEQMSLNFSTQFLIILLQLKNMYEKTMKKKENPSDFLEKTSSNDSIISHSLSNACGEMVEAKVSPYTIKNETGYTIEVDLDTQHSPQQQQVMAEATIVRNNKIVNFDVQSELNENQFFEEQKDEKMNQKIRSDNQMHKVKVGVQMGNKANNKLTVGNIDIDRMRSQKVYFNNDKSMYGSTEVRLDLATNRKILYIASPYVFENNTKNKVMLKFGKKVEKKNEQGKKAYIVEGEAFKLRPKSRLPLPIDCINQYFQFSMTDRTGVEFTSAPQKVSDLGNSKKLDVQLSDKQRYMRLRCQQDETNRHKVIVYMEPPFKFKNCLPKPMFFQVLSAHKKTTITKEIHTDDIYEEFNHSGESKIYLKISLPGFFWSNESPLSADNNLTNIPIKDHNSNVSGIQVNQTQVPNGTIEYFFYCSSYLVNESKYDLLCYTKQDKKSPVIVGGQDEIMPEDDIERNLVIFGKKQGDHLVISDRANPKKYSQEVGISTPGDSEIQAYVMESNAERVISMGVDVQLLKANSEPLIMTKQITVSPRYILVNNTNHMVLAKQEGEQGNKFAVLQKGDRQPIFWSNPSLPKEVNLQLFDNASLEKDTSLIGLNDSKWEWSKNINVNNVGIINFAMHSKDKSEILFLRTDTREGGSNIFVVIEEVPLEQVPYKIINNTSCMDIELQNPGYDGKLVAMGKETSFSWFEPNTAKKLHLNLVPSNGNYEAKEVDFCPDIINNKQKFEIKPIKGTDKKTIKPIFVKKTISIDGYTKIVTFEDSLKTEKLNKKKTKDAEMEKGLEEAKEEMKENDENIQRESDRKSVTSRQSSNELFSVLQQINVCFKGIGLSLVMNHKSTGSKEILYLYMKNFEFIQLEKQKKKLQQIRLQYINIDNNAEHIVQHPVILTPSHHKAHTHSEKPQNWLNVYIDQNLTTNTITLYDNITVDIEPFTVKIEEAFLNSVLELIASYNEIQESINAETNLKEKQKQNEQLHGHLKKREFIWQTAEIPESSAPTFIDQLVLTNIQCNLTFQAKSRTGDTGSSLVLFETLFSAIGVVLANIDDAPIKLNGIRLNSCFDSMNGITSKLIQHYKKQAITEGLKVVGSLNVLGNPVGLFSNISSGVEDLVTKPMEGLVQGPLETGLGIVSGSASLLTKTISGAFNSVSKITGSVSTGIAALSMDEEYMKERERMKANKPKHIVDGLGQGIVSIVGGIGKGIAGVFLKPFEGAKKDGIKGFFKGTAMGIAGLVTKPITGAIDAVSQTAEGMKNMVSFMEDKPNTQRERAPRVFYGYDKYYKEYYDLDAEMLTVLQLYKKGRYARDDFFTTFQFKSKEDDKHNLVFILLLGHMILLSEKNCKRVWIIDNGNVQNVKYTNEGVQFFLKKKNKYTESKTILLTMTDKPMQKRAYETVNELLVVYEDEKKFLAQDMIEDDE